MSKKTTYIIKRTTLWNSGIAAEDVPGYIVHVKTGLFSKDYVGHSETLYQAELMIGKHKTRDWDLKNRIILKI